MSIQKPEFILPEEYRQMALDLELPEVESDSVSPEEAKRRSEAALQALKARSGNDVPAWIGTFFELTDGGWPWRQAVYIAWASTPREKRIPATQDELARNVLGLTSDRPIATWKKRNPAILEMIALLQSAPLWEHRADIYDALIKVAISPEYKGHNDRKLALEMLGDYVPRSKVEADLNKSVVDDLSNLPFEEKLRLAGLKDPEKLAEFRKKFSQPNPEEPPTEGDKQ